MLSKSYSDILKRNSYAVTRTDSGDELQDMDDKQSNPPLNLEKRKVKETSEREQEHASPGSVHPSSSSQWTDPTKFNDDVSVISV